MRRFEDLPLAGLSDLFERGFDCVRGVSYNGLLTCLASIHSNVFVALLASLAYSACLLGIVGDIIKVWRVPELKPDWHETVLMRGHRLRFLGWLLLGCSIIQVDPMTACMLIGTRGLGFLLVGVSLSQRYVPKPRLGKLATHVGGELTFLVALGLLVAIFSPQGELEAPTAFLAALGFLWTLVGLCQQIWRAGTGGISLRRVRRAFQWGMLISYALHLLYAGAVQASLTQLLFHWGYLAAVLLQPIYVVQIELQRRRKG